MIDQIDEPQSNPVTRGLIDMVYGSPRPWGFMIGVLAVCIPALLFTADLLGGGVADDESSGGGDPDRPSTLAWVATSLLWAVTLAVVASQWVVRRYYRLMFGSGYHKG